MLSWIGLKWESDPEAWKRDRHAILLSLLGALVLFATLIALFMSQSKGFSAAVGIGGVIIFSGMSIGAIFGFLFSVPRVLSRDGGQTPSGTHSPESDAIKKASRERLLATNTNLERISEWLTTMLVGVGLTQIGSLGEKAAKFSEFVEKHARVFPEGDPHPAGSLPGIAPFLLVFGLVSGFIFFYIYTRIFLAELFNHAERSMAAGDEPVVHGAAKIRSEAAAMAEGSNDPTMAKAAGGSQISVNESLDVIYRLLYEPDGYKKVVEIGNDLARTAAAGLPRFWYLMACAFGQKHHALLTSGDTDALKSAKLAVYGAVRQAVRLDPNCRRWFKMLTSSESEDNDLQDFGDDSEFLKLVG